MRCFVLLTDTDGLGLTDELMRRYEALPRRRGWEYVWQRFGNAAVLLAWDDAWGDSLVVREDGYLAAGTVRLDNRTEVGGWSGLDRVEWQRLNDLELVLKVVARYGIRYIRDILGDFAFVAWHGPTRRAVAAVDAFAVKKLYYASRTSHIAFASRAELLALEERYNVEYLTRLVAAHLEPRDATVYIGVLPVPPASTCVMAEGAVRTTTYWSPNEFEIKHGWEEQEAETVARCRELVAESVRLRMGDDGKTWAQLSGGLDSSSVVSVAEWLHERGQVPHGLAGTVTHVHRPGSGADERAYSDAVVQQWRVRNEVIVDAPTWYEEGQSPTMTDQPNTDLSVGPREYRVATLVRSTGGRALLTGWGGDELFGGNLLFFADWAATGQFGRAVRGMAHYAAVGRVSFWDLAYESAVLPLLPSPVRRRLIRDERPAQPWLNETTLRRYQLVGRSLSEPDYQGRYGRKYRHAVLIRMARLVSVAAAGTLPDLIDVRHPMMYRPLVELAAQLPPGLRGRPHAQRWVLRAAMRSILPERVRTRVGKQDTGEAVAWLLGQGHGLLAPLLEAPVLADLGIVQPVEFRAALTAPAPVTVRRQLQHVPALTALAVEAWLQMRSGKWPRGAAFGRTEGQQYMSTNHEPAPRLAEPARRSV